MISKSAICRHRELALIGAVIVADALLCIWLLERNDWLTNVAFLILGALVSVFTILLSDRLRRQTLKRDLAHALYVELSERVARCCFDMEAPWKNYLDMSKQIPLDMSIIRIRKFSPEQPVIFLSSASQLPILGREPAQALLQFYYRLSAWQRDTENVASYGVVSNSDIVEPKHVQLLAKRLRQTLNPGMRALEALSALVEGYAEIEAASLAGYDEHRPVTPTSDSLRHRLKEIMEATKNAS